MKHIGEGSRWLPDPMWFPHDNMQQEFSMTNTPKRRGPKPWKRKPHIIFRIGNIQLVWMRKPT